MERIRIVLEFNKKSIEELKLYNELVRYSSPPNLIKDILMGLIDIPVNMKEIKGPSVTNVDSNNKEE